MKDLIEISSKTYEIYEKVLPKVSEEFRKIDDLCEYNNAKMMNAFFACHVSETHFNMTTGYGYNDLGRDVVEEVFAHIFKAEKAIVRTQFVSGSHTLCKTFFALLRPNNLLLSITGTPYDTLHEVIGIKPNPSSLKSFGIKYDEIPLINDDFDYDKIAEYLEKHQVKVIEIQRSKGYSTRKSLNILKVEKVCKLIKKISPETIIMVDNCYCEFVSEKEPIEVGADIVVGSLIKNLGGGLANNGGYVVGKKELIDLVGESLTLPGEGLDVGPSLGANKLFLQGIFMAPTVVASALKTSVLASAMLEELGYKVSPLYNEEKADIVLTINFGNEKDLINFCKGIQSGSPIDSYVSPIPVSTPGYTDKVIMAAGNFVQGSSIELSCDGPIREPYIAYLQGGLTYDTGKIGILKAIDRLISDE